MNKITALTVLAESFISSKAHPTDRDFDIVATALRDELPAAAEHAAACAAHIREAARNQMTLKGILQEAIG